MDPPSGRVNRILNLEANFMLVFASRSSTKSTLCKSWESAVFRGAERSETLLGDREGFLLFRAPQANIDWCKIAGDESVISLKSAALWIKFDGTRSLEG